MRNHITGVSVERVKDKESTIVLDMIGCATKPIVCMRVMPAGSLDAQLGLPAPGGPAKTIPALYRLSETKVR